MVATFTHCTGCGSPLPSAALLNVCARCAFTAASAGPAELPEIEDCEVLGLAGEGGMGRVYRGCQSAAGGRAVAIKVLSPGALSPLADERFAREAALLARLSHPNVASVYGAGLTDSGERYLMMEWIEGRPLPEAVRAAMMNPGQIAAVMAKACDGVQAAHAINIVHRDLKPANILADAAGEQVKVLDFGLARDLDELCGLSLSGAVLGTPDFMAPEQIRSEPCGPAADVFALGIVLHLCLTGRHPFPAQTLSQRLNASASAVLPALDASIPRDLSAILRKALEADLSLRYRTAGDMAEDLRRWIEGRPVLAQPPGALYLTRKFVARHRAAAAAAVAALLCAAGAGAWHWHTREEAARELQEQYADTLLVSAELHGQRGQWAPALEEIAKAELAGARDPGRTALARIEALLAAGRRTEAQQMLASLPASASAAHPGLLDYWRAQLLDGNEAIPQAEALLRDALKSGLPPALESICTALLSDDEAETETRLAQAVQAEPWSHQALMLHALALAFTGSREEGRIEAAAAARLFPQSRDLAFCASLIEAQGGVPEPADAGSESSLLGDMRFLMQQRADIYNQAWQVDGNPLSRILKARTILSRVNASRLLGSFDPQGADAAIPSLVLRFLGRLQERELKSVKLLHEQPPPIAAHTAMLESEIKRRRPSPVVICICASVLIKPALNDNDLSAKVESACAAVAAQPGILDGERALLLEMCATQTLYRLPGNPDPAPKQRSIDYARRRLAIPVPSASLPASVISEGMLICDEFALARSYAEAFRNAGQNDPAAVLQQARVESKAGEWQRCIAFTDEMPASASADQKLQVAGLRKDALSKLRESLQRLDGAE